MGKRVAIVQSNYIPWKGYFDLINSVDEFILYDDMQYTRRDWRNRNKIKTSNGLKWLTIPVHTKGNYFQSIKEITVSDQDWKTQHWKTLTYTYNKAAYFNEFKDTFKELYVNCQEQYLSKINKLFLRAICKILDIRTVISWSMDYHLVEGKTERLVDLCKQSGATSYLSGPQARSYIDESLFRDANIELAYIDYSYYPEYKQLFPPFDHAVSILDLIFNQGQNATQYMKTFNSKKLIEKPDRNNTFNEQNRLLIG